MTFFLVLWPYLLTTKLRCLQKNNIGHTKQGTPPEQSKIQTEARRIFIQIKDNLEDKTEKEIKENFLASNGWFANFKKRNKVQRVQLVLNDLNDQEYYGEVENVTRDTKFIYYVTIEDDVVGKNGLLYNEEYFHTSNFFRDHSFKTSANFHDF